MTHLSGSLKYRIVLAIAFISLVAMLGSQPAPREQVGPLPGGAFLLNSGWRLDPVGRQIPLDTLPMSTALSPDGKYLLVLNGGYRPPSVSVIETASGRVTGSVPVADGWLGLAISPKGDTVYVGGGSKASLFEFSFANGVLTPARTFVVVPQEQRGNQDFIGDVAFSPDGRLLYAADLYHDSVVAINPTSGSGNSRSFALTVSDSIGANDIASVVLLVNGTLTGTGGCFVNYSAANNSLSLANNAVTAWTGPSVVGSGAALSNSQCTVNAAGASVSTSGTNLTVNIPISFTAAFAGAKSTWGYAANNAALNSGYQLTGSWTVTSGGAAASKVGVFSSTTAMFVLDGNGNFAWDGTPTDRFFPWGGANKNPKYQIVVGDWNVYGRVYMSTAGRGLVYGNIGPVTTGIASHLQPSTTVSIVSRGNLLRIEASGLADLRLELCGADGRIFLSRKVEDGQNVSLSSLPRGILFARLASQGRQVASRTVVRN